MDINILNDAHIFLASSEFLGGSLGYNSNALAADNPFSENYSVCFSLRDRIYWIWMLVVAIFALTTAGSTIMRGLQGTSIMMGLAIFFAIIFAGDVATELASSLCEVNPQDFKSAVKQR